MTTTNYIWDEQNLLAESDATNTINVVYTSEPQQYGNLISSRVSGTASYHHFDVTDSTRQLTNVAGAITDTILYDAWGNILSRIGSSVVAMLFGGAVFYYSDADTGLPWVRSRAYTAPPGRWTSTDPLLFNILELTLQRYVYASNSPVLRQDPSGALSYVAGNKKLGHFPCDVDAPPFIQWEIRIDGVYLVPFGIGRRREIKRIQGAPCDGFIVQKVTVDCQGSECRKKSAIDVLRRYWEAIPVSLGDRFAGPDTASGGIPASSSGAYLQTGEVKLYCSDKRDAKAIGKAAVGASTRNWRREENWFGKGLCQTTAGTFTSTPKEPDFWTEPPIEGPAMRDFLLTWRCCGGPRVVGSIDAQAKPT
jgi:RHS repeat-associated protein